MRTLMIIYWLALSLVVTTNAGLAQAKPTARIARDAKAAEVATYKLSQSKDVVLNLLGTTPVRDWKMTANGLTGDATMVVINNALTEIRALSFALPVQNLHADVAAMEEDAHEALKADRHKEITFVLKNARIELQTNNSYLVTALGSLSVAGVTREVTLMMHSQINSQGTITFAGTQLLKMSDYDVERPSLLFGAIKAGNDMTLTYRLIFKK
jgi:hypothetical protein